MPKFELSMTGPERTYVLLQGRIYPDGRLHVQGRGPRVNREYGVAVDLTLPEELRSWWMEQAHDRVSLAGTHAMYVEFHAEIRQFPVEPVADSIRAQVRGKELNRVHGVSMVIARNEGSEDLFSFLEAYTEEVDTDITLD